jgi:hypothetical protein
MHIRFPILSDQDADRNISTVFTVVGVKVMPVNCHGCRIISIPQMEKSNKAAITEAATMEAYDTFGGFRDRIDCY